MERTQDHKPSARGRFSTILRIFEGIFQKKILHSMTMYNLALLDMLKSTETNYTSLESPDCWCLDSWRTGVWQVHMDATPSIFKECTFLGKKGVATV